MTDLEKIKAKYPLGGRPVAFKSPQEMLEKIYEYLLACEQRKITVATKDGIKEIPSPAPITIEGLCAFAGITKTTFYVYQKKPRFRAIITQYRQIVEKYFVEQCVEGKPGNKADFILKNAFADEWKEKSSLVNVDGVEGISISIVKEADKKEAEE